MYFPPEILCCLAIYFDHRHKRTYTAAKRASETGPYEVVPNWPQNPCGEGYQIGSSSGIFAESPDRIFIFARGCLPELTDGSFGGYQSLIPSRNASGYDLSRDDEARHPVWNYVLYIVDRDGELVENWDQHNKMFVRPHRVKINPYDPERHVWVVDDGAQQVTKFTRDGKKVVMQLGEFRKRGNDESHFGRPTDVAWLPDGTFFVSDGYTNTRVVKFDKDGNFLMTWGEKGNAPNETRPSYMNTVHGIAIDDNRRVYVADRANSRIQVFDENGKYLDEWGDIKRPYYIYMSEDQHLCSGRSLSESLAVGATTVRITLPASDLLEKLLHPPLQHDF